MTPQLVAVTPYGRLGASSRVRVLEWIEHLQLRAVRCHYAEARNNGARTLAKHPKSVLQAEWRLRHAVPADIPLVMSREATPFSRGEIESRLLRRASHGVYDLDDPLFDDHGSGVRRFFSKAVKCRVAAIAADQVIAGNETLADWASRHNRNVTLIPSCVEPAHYIAKESWVLHRVPRIVWIGSPATEQYLRSIATPLLTINGRMGARLTVVSSGNRTLGELDQMVDRVEWTPSHAPVVLSRSDLAIGPLLDTPYSRGKCAYKLLQYAATAMPIIATPIGANALALDRFGGVAASTNDEWTEALLTLLTDSAARREEYGTRALRGVQEHYSFERWAPTWRQAVGV
jgi:glycosyltransferase involved in cell wall biosynthesis